MEESGAAAVGTTPTKEMEKVGEITRTQSSLELLSNTALATSESEVTSGNGGRVEEISQKITTTHHDDSNSPHKKVKSESPSVKSKPHPQPNQMNGGGEDSSASACSHQTSSSARVTPSISQVSIAAETSGGETLVSGKDGAGTGKSESSSTMTDPLKPPVAAVGGGFIPTSPYTPPNHSRVALSTATTPTTMDTTGLPIDHYSAYAAVPLHGSSFFPSAECYLQPPPHHFFATAPSLQAPSLQHSTATAAPPAYAAPSSGNTTGAPMVRVGSLSSATQAAFVPPRSSSVRSTSSGGSSGSHHLQQPLLSYHGMPPTSTLIRQPTPHMQQYAMQHLQPQQAQVPHNHLQGVHGTMATAPGTTQPPSQEHPTNLTPRTGSAPPSSSTITTNTHLKCESFQSDSTASLTSEQHHGKKGRSPPRVRSPPRPKEPKPSYAELEAANQMLVKQNADLKNDLEKRNQEVSVLREEVRELDVKVRELRQFPAGKISQIPMADMLEIMQTYGSEVSDTVMPPRKLNIQKASVIRQFRRWNPNFLKHFYFQDGKWIPKLGKEGELARRQVARKKGGAKNPDKQGHHADQITSGTELSFSNNMATTLHYHHHMSSSSIHSLSNSPVPPGLDNGRKRKYGQENQPQD